MQDDDRDDDVPPPPTPSYEDVSLYSDDELEGSLQDDSHCVNPENLFSPEYLPDLTPPGLGGVAVPGPPPSRIPACVRALGCSVPVCFFIWASQDKPQILVPLSLAMLLVAVMNMVVPAMKRDAKLPKEVPFWASEGEFSIPPICAFPASAAECRAESAAIQIEKDKLLAEIARKEALLVELSKEEAEWTVAESRAAVDGSSSNTNVWDCGSQRTR